MIVADTGPLVALLDRRDRWHAWAVREFGALRDPIVTCEAVVSEACFVLRSVHRGGDAVLGLVEKGVVVLRATDTEDVPRLRSLITRYGDVPMSFADACLVRITERVPDSEVLTLDADFRVYRRLGRQLIPVRMPQ